MTRPNSLRSLEAVLRVFIFDLGAPFLLAYQYRFLPDELDLLSFVPFCALVGGLAGAGRALILNQPEEFPKGESIRGALYGVIFGFFFICFGTL